MKQTTQDNPPISEDISRKRKPSQLMDMLNVKQALRYITLRDIIDCLIIIGILVFLSWAEIVATTEYLVLSVLAARTRDILIGWICANTAITWRDKYKSEISGQTRE